MPTKITVALLLIGFNLLLVGCQSAYYSMWEKLGKEKRHLLRDNIEEARDSQQQASEEFKDALTRIKTLYGFEGGDLEAVYNQLSDDYEGLKSRSETIQSRIQQVQDVAEDLFAEWESEIADIKKAEFKAQSARKLAETRKRYAKLERSMLMSVRRMSPVLDSLRDYVLYLKHNLNAQAVGALKTEAIGIERDVDLLVTDIQKSIREADAFLAELE